MGKGTAELKALQALSDSELIAEGQQPGRLTFKRKDNHLMVDGDYPRAYRTEVDARLLDVIRVTANGMIFSHATIEWRGHVIEQWPQVEGPGNYIALDHPLASRPPTMGVTDEGLRQLRIFDAARAATQLNWARARIEQMTLKSRSP